MSPARPTDQTHDTMLGLVLSALEDLRGESKTHHAALDGVRERLERIQSDLSLHVSAETAWQERTELKVDALSKRVDEHQPIVTEARDDRVRRAGIAKAAAALAAIVGATWAAGDSVVKVVEALMNRRP